MRHHWSPANFPGLGAWHPLRGANRWILVAALSSGVVATARAEARAPAPSLDSLPPNQWVEAYRSTDRAGWLQRHAGAVYDSRRARVVMFGSDTHDRPTLNLDNAVHDFDPASGRWSRHYAPAPAATYRGDSRGFRIAGRERLLPWSMHVFDAMVYDPGADALIVMSAPLHHPLRQQAPTAKADPTWIYDLASQRWHMLANDGKRPPVFFAGAAAYDPHRDTIVAYGRGLWELGPDRDRWIRASSEKHHTWSFMMEYEPRSRMLMVFGDNRQTNHVWTYRPGPSPGSSGVWSERIPAGNGCPASAQFPVAYDKRAGVFLIIPHDLEAGLSVTCIYDPAANAYTRLPKGEMPLLGSDENMPAMSYSMVYDDQRGVFLLLGGYRRDATTVSALRLAPELLSD